MGILIGKDAAYFQHAFKEMAHLIGIECRYQYIINKQIDSSSEIDGNFSEPIPMDIILEDYPAQKTLKRLGWLSVDSEDKPIIAMLPISTPNLQRGCRILIRGAIAGDWKTFRITEISNIMVVPESFTVKLAPEFDSLLQGDLHKNYARKNMNYVTNEEDGTV